MHDKYVETRLEEACRDPQFISFIPLPVSSGYSTVASQFILKSYLNLWQHWVLSSTPSMKRLSELLRVLLYSGFPSTPLTWPLTCHILFHLCSLAAFWSPLRFPPFLNSLYLFSFSDLTHTPGFKHTCILMISKYSSVVQKYPQPLCVPCIHYLFISTLWFSSHKFYFLPSSAFQVKATLKRVAQSQNKIIILEPSLPTALLNCLSTSFPTYFSHLSSPFQSSNLGIFLFSPG